jgi:hypothetical protein
MAGCGVPFFWIAVHRESHDVGFAESNPQLIASWLLPHSFILIYIIPLKCLHCVWEASVARRIHLGGFLRFE